MSWSNNYRTAIWIINDIGYITCDIIYRLWVSKPIQIIPNQSKKGFVSHFMKNGQTLIWLNPINSETQSEWI